MIEGDEPAPVDSFVLSRSTLASLFDFVDEAILCISADGSVVFASRGWQTLLGFDPASAVGRNVVDLVHPDDIVDVAEALRIDDFGTGYSSVLQLKQLPLTALKIDRAFVMGLPDDPIDAAIVRTTVDLAQSMGLTVTAEGVETEPQRDALLALGCRRAQGYLLSRPEPAADFRCRLPADP